MRAAMLTCLVAAGCGGAVCGDGKAEGDEQCDDGNVLDGDACSSTCRAVATVDTFVHFGQFIAHQFPGFIESCQGLGIARVEVAVSGPRNVTESEECAFEQIKLSSLPDGAYTVTARALDASGAVISRGMASAAFTVAGRSQDVTIEWPWEDFTRSYTGTFFFRVLWQGSDSCAGAAPPVVKQRLVLARNGTPLEGMTQGGDRLDGMTAGSCRDGSEALSQAAVGLAWGPVTMTVTGEDGDGRALFRGSFDTFVGAGVGNPTITMDVPSILPDAGPADAGLPDAGPADAAAADGAP